MIDKTSEQAKLQTLDVLGVSRETLSGLSTYMSALAKWQAKINLVSNSTLPDMWQRHFVDSLQILKYLPKSGPKQIVDFGSGAGFPGLVISLCSNHPISLIEANAKKGAFLRHIVSELGLTAQIVTSRIEAAQVPTADIITARAFASLTDILKLGQQHTHPTSQYLLLKGATWEDEVNQAKQEGWRFKYQSFQSETDTQGVVLQITEIQHVR